MNLAGLHHVTAISTDILGNYRFYTQVLGMRLVKRTVNQDDVGAYHLFYADGIGTPGTDVTFFDWSMPREQRGTNSITRTHLRVARRETLDWWSEHLTAADVSHSGISERHGRLTLDFEDPERQRLSLIDDGGLGEAPVIWEKSPVPASFQIRGLGPSLISVPSLAPTAKVLENVLKMKQVRSYQLQEQTADSVHVFQMGEGGPHAELHIAVQPELRAAHADAGGVHHIAFRIPDREQYEAWAERLIEFRIPNSGPVDRFYFRSLYFREPAGILFELATDGPGFAVDEDAATLGEKIALPPFLEQQRAEITANLKPLD